jgi:ABC-type sugar transport system permease subunit
MDETLDAWLLLLPLLLLMALFTALPTLSNFYYSLTRWNGISKPVFIGFENFSRMFTDSRFLVS